MIEDKYAIIAEEIKRLFSGGDPSDDSELDERELILLVQQAHASLVRTEYFANIKAGNDHTVDSLNFTTFTKLPVQFDSELKLDYTILPGSYISLPGNKGIHTVSMYGKPNALPIVPLKPGMASMLEGTFAGNMNGRLTYYPEGERIYFPVKGEDCKLPFTHVNIRLVLPSGKSVSLGQELAIMGEVTKLMAQRRPQDKTNDNNPTV